MLGVAQPCGWRQIGDDNGSPVQKQHICLQDWATPNNKTPAILYATNRYGLCPYIELFVESNSTKR